MKPGKNNSIPKTNAARILDRAGIAYRLVPYLVDEDDLGAGHLAAELGVDVDSVFKTLVLRGDRTGHFVCVVPGGRELDLKKAAKVSGNKSCAMLPLRELQSTTGYVRGGCSPVGMKKAFPTYIHQSVLEHGEVHVSAGLRGVQFLLAPADLVAATKGVVADLVAG